MVENKSLNAARDFSAQIHYAFGRLAAADTLRKKKNARRVAFAIMTRVKNFIEREYPTEDRYTLIREKLHKRMEACVKRARREGGFETKTRRFRLTSLMPARLKERFIDQYIQINRRVATDLIEYAKKLAEEFVSANKVLIAEAMILEE